MRRLLTLAAFLLVISLVPLCAQRGGHASGGSHGGFSGHSGFSGHAGGMSASRGIRGGSFAARGSSIRVASGSRFRSDRNFRGPRINSSRFGNRCYGCRGFGYPFYGSYDPYFYDPYWWWDSSSSYDGDAERERSLASEMNAENLDEQRMLQEQDAYAQPAYGPPSRAAMQTSREQDPVDPPTVLVFRDQHQREIQNYAIVGQMLWSFSPQRTEKIPLAQLDIPATTKANDDRGVDFRLPRASEGQ